jgi:DNA-binding NarL/FixJ family response regulator
VTTVLIVDDQPLQRFGFRMLLEAAPDTEVAGEAAHGAEAVRRTAELRPDVVLMDIRMPGMDGIEATRHIVATGGRSRVLVLTTFDLDEYAYSALRAGAVIAPALTRRLLDTYAHRLPDGTDARAGRDDPRWLALSEREREILVAIGQGWTNGEIAGRLVLSESTVKTHVGRVLAKIGARDRIQAVIVAYDLGLAQPHGPA